MGRKAEIWLEYMNYIENPPVPTDQMYGQACSNDKITINSWRDTWISNAKATKKRFGSFKDNGVGKLFGQYAKQPVIIAGSGPSLKYNGSFLKDRAGIPLVSCLHNFHFFEDNDVAPEYYVTLDAGPITVSEVWEGGQHDEDWYWERTKDRTLIAYIGTCPELFEKWRGKVYLYNATLPDDVYTKAIEEIEPFHTYISNGGNVLGACLYAAKGIFGGNPIAFVGADFCFSYERKFHGWDSKYDANIGQCVRAVDVYGNSVLSWSSYMNFKSWFDYIAMRVPGIYVNCSEGGTFGAYPDGNLMAVKQQALKEFIGSYQLHENIKEQCINPSVLQNAILF